MFLLSDHAGTVRELVLSQFEHSAEYSSYFDIQEWTSIAFDRVLSGLRGHLEFTKLDEMGGVLDGVMEAHQSGRIPERDRAAERWMEHHLEHWLKALWSLVDPKDYEDARREAEMRRAQGKTPQFNLFAALTRLKLLEIAEANLETGAIESIEDPIRRALAYARHARNATHGTSSSGVPQATTLCLVAIVAPIVKHSAQLRRALSGVIARPLSLTNEQLQLMRSVSEARRSHLQRFGGRLRWLETIRRKLVEVSKEGGYLVITGPEGQGKSALCSKLSEELCAECLPIGPAAASVRRDAPWLPGVLMHLGKQSRNPRDAAQLVAGQANTLLMRDIALPDDSTISIYSPTASSRMDSDYSEVRTRPISREDRLEGAGRAALLRAGLDDYRAVLFDACHRLVEETGRALVIIDAIDEITRNGDELRFLPDPVPRGAAFLLTVRSNLGLESWLQSNRPRVEVVSLENLERAEVPLLTRVADEEEGIKFNNAAFEHSNGWAYMLASIGVQVEKEGGGFKNVRLANVAQSMLERQAEEWRSRDQISRDPLGVLLPVLSLFEPCAPISVDCLQSYLLHQGIELRRPELASLLRTVGHQLDGLGANRVKLAQSVFAEYVRETYLSAHDYRAIVEQIASWLAVDDVVEPELVVRFICHRARIGERGIQSRTAGDLVSSMSERGRSDALFRVGAALVKEERAEEAQQFLEAAVNLGHAGACAGLGKEIFAGRLFARDERRAEELFRRAVDGGHRLAIVHLSLLLARKEAPGALEESIGLLRRASEDQPLAMWILADHLFDGIGVERDQQEAEALLRKSASSLKSSARILAERLAKGDGVTKNRTEALEIWRRLANEGDAKAMYLLGLYLGDEEDPETLDEMRLWLQRAADKDHPGACTILGHRILHGLEYPPSPSLGEHWLRKGIALGNLRARAFLGDAILDGLAESTSLEEGMRLLEESASEHDVVGVTELGVRLASGVGCERDAPRGVSLLREAAEADSLRAMTELGKVLLDSGDASEGERWLVKAQGSGYEPAIFELADRLAAGNGLPQDVDAARELFSAAANQGSADSMRRLASLSDTLEEAITWLGRAAEIDATAYIEMGLKLHHARLFEQAAAAFFAGHLNLVRDGSNNLAYMIRRDEVVETSRFPSVPELLNDHVDCGNAFVLINLALHGVQKRPGPDAWRDADALISRISSEALEASKWWHELAVAGEEEGHLVLWWLARHDKAEDPDGMEPRNRLGLVDEGRRPPER